MSIFFPRSPFQIDLGKMQKHSVRLDFTGQQCSCLTATSWIPHSATTIGSNKIQILRLEDKVGHHFVSVNTTGISPKDSKFLRINGNFGRSLNLSHGKTINVSEINGVPPKIKSAYVSCVCVDDWEILESNAEIVTNTLLNQLRVVYCGLQFPFWVTKSMTINLRIDKIDPGAEFGILDSSSEIVIPSIITNIAKPSICISGLPKLRLHPIVLFKTQLNYFVPSVSILFNNVRHAFAHKAAFGDSSESEANETNAHIFAKFFISKINNRNCPELIKIFLLDNLDINEAVLNKSFPLTNPPSLYVHPKLVENCQDIFPLLSSIFLEQTSSTQEDFQQTENAYSPFETHSEKISCSDFAGFEKLIKNGCDFLKAALSLENIQHNCTGPTFGNLLITGKEGCGKTEFASRLIQEFAGHPLFVHSESISCPKLRGKKSESIEKHFNTVFESAIRFQPTVIVLDDLDVLTPSPRVEQQNAAEDFHCLRVCETLMDCLMQCEGQQIAVVATAKGFDTLNAFWKSRQGFHFFHKCIYIPPPNPLERLKIFQVCIQPYLKNSDAAENKGSDVAPYSSLSGEKSTAPNTESSSAVKLASTFSEAMTISLSAIHDEFASPQIIRRVAAKWALHLLENKQNEPCISKADEKYFQQIIDDEIENFGGGPSEDTVKTTWAQIGGLKHVKKELTKILEWPIKYPKLFENSPVKLPSGILLYGYPGSGKTLLALAVPSIVNAKFIHIKGPELLSKYIGASEQSVKDLFQRARNCKPCVLFFDEFDSLVPRRGHDSTGVTDRVVNQFLTEMDGVDGGIGQGVHLIAATSRPDLIDPAVLRPGRLDKHLLFPMPTKEERIEILKRQSEQTNLSHWGDEDWDLIGRETEGFTGADLHALLFSAQMASIQEYLGKLESNESSPGRNEHFETGSESDPPERYGKEKVLITMEHMRSSLATFQPSLQGKELEKFRRIYEQFSSARDGNSSRKGGSTFTSMSGKRATLA